jgi:hypothetical protein
LEKSVFGALLIVSFLVFFLGAMGLQSASQGRTIPDEEYEAYKKAVENREAPPGYVSESQNLFTFWASITFIAGGVGYIVFFILIMIFKK